MEKQTKHRILGVMVVIALVIILLPFFQSGKELASDTTLVNAPPFPEQSVQTTATAAADEEPSLNSQDLAPPTITEAAHEADSAVPVSQPLPVDMLKTIRPNVVNDAKTSESVKSADIKSTVTNDEEIKIKMALDNKKPVLKHGDAAPRKILPIAKKGAKKAVIPDLPLDDDGLTQLKNAAWVIQLGSFKDKSNALHLVNQLRAKGYSAFIQRVSTSLGSSTRVFVGPESQRNSAHALATQLEDDMHLHGIVISYKPLTL